MAGEDAGYKWWLRYVLIPLVGGGGVVAIAVAVLNRPRPVTPSPEPPIGQHQPAQSQEPSDQRDQVEKAVARWLAAWLNGDTDGSVRLASEPFYFDQRILLTKADIRVAYDALRQEKGESWKQLEIASIKVQTARELQATGYDLSHDRIFASLNLTLDDYAVTVISPAPD